MQDFRDLIDEASDFENSSEGWGFDLRLDLADMILKGLKDKKWAQRELAKQVGMKASFINRVIHGGSNCTFDVAGRILFALGMKPMLAEVTSPIGIIENGAICTTRNKREDATNDETELINRGTEGGSNFREARYAE